MDVSWTSRNVKGKNMILTKRKITENENKISRNKKVKTQNWKEKEYRKGIAKEKKLKNRRTEKMRI